jgi:ribosome maturation factor RimP
MDKHKSIAEKVYDIASYNLTKAGYEVIDVEYRKERTGNVLRVFIDKKGRISAQDCEKVTHILSSAIDVDVPIHFSYTLEVSSPGLTRELKRKEEYMRFRGRDIRIITRQPVLNKVVLEGTLRGMKDEDVLIDNDGIEIMIPYRIIKKANLTFKA